MTTSITAFATRAAATAEVEDRSTLEVGPKPDHHGELFAPDRYQAVRLPIPRIEAYPGFVPNHPVASLAVEDGAFGLVLCLDGMAESHEPCGLMTELARPLQPAGLLFLVSPLIVPERRHRPSGRRFRIGLNYLLDAAGFFIEDLVPVDEPDRYALIARKGRERRAQERTGFKNRPV